MNTKGIILAASLVVASLGMATGADAQQYRGDRNGYDHQRGDGRDYRAGRHDNGRHNGWRNGRGHRRCWTEYRHHRQVRVCR